MSDDAAEGGLVIDRVGKPSLLLQKPKIGGKKNSVLIPALLGSTSLTKSLHPTPFRNYKGVGQPRALRLID